MQLVIDSATAACSAALIGPDGKIIDQRHEIVGRGHAERLLPMIADLLAGHVPDAILVDCGPGSFTGVRVGLAAAHGLAIGWKVPLAGYSSMAAVAAAAAAGLAVCPLARRVAPRTLVDVGAKFGLPPLPHSQVVLYSRVRDTRAAAALRRFADSLAISA